MSRPSKKTYVCGPMSGHPNFNFDAFDRAAECLRTEGMTVFNPHEHDQETYPDIDNAKATVNGDLAGLIEEIGFDLSEAMRWDLARVAEADCLALLPGWEESTGARAERLVAEMTGTEIWLAHPHGDRFDFVLDPIQKRLATIPKQTIVGGVRGLDDEMRTFDTGANRDAADHKHDLEGFLSPLVLREFGRYMHANRQTPNGLRASDNWQKGIPADVYMKSGWRHFHDWWTLHRGWDTVDFDGNNVDVQDALCGLLFNTMGYLHELLAAEQSESSAA